MRLKINNLPKWVWVFLPTLLFVLAWEPIGFTPLLFVSFIPFFVIAKTEIQASKWKYYGQLYLALLGWNISVTWWVFFASDIGSIVMIILNSLFMLVPFIIFRLFKNREFSNSHFLLFSLGWIFYEYGHHRWDLSWPWLCLGNGFSGMVGLIQWYEFTGTLGGTLWVLFANWFFFNWINTGNFKWIKYNIITFCFLVTLSILLYFTTSINKGDKINVTVLQPSFDPWTEKFVRNPVDMTMEMIDSSKSNISSKTNWILWPETSLVSNIDIDNKDADIQINLIYNYLLNTKDSLNNISFPNLQVLTGFNGIQYYKTNVKPNRSARRSKYEDNLYYNLYNSALCLSSNNPSTFYHKSKLVPGTEQLPFIQTFPILENLALTLDENSSTGSLGISESPFSLGNKYPVAPIICYESIYGDYIRGYLKNGAKWLGIITNDAWWHNTPGHKQHFSYAKLRAIEFRKWVARSANTGTSGFIDPLGKSYNETKWFEKCAVSKEIYSNSIKTVYYYMGDLGFIAAYIGLLALIFLLFRNRI
jgi:apolipoprotein N-acyltransferase